MEMAPLSSKTGALVKKTFPGLLDPLPGTFRFSGVERLNG